MADPGLTFGRQLKNGVPNQIKFERTIFNTAVVIPQEGNEEKAAC